MASFRVYRLDDHDAPHITIYLGYFSHFSQPISCDPKNAQTLHLIVTGEQAMRSRDVNPSLTGTGNATFSFRGP